MVAESESETESESVSVAVAVSASMSFSAAYAASGRGQRSLPEGAAGGEGAGRWSISILVHRPVLVRFFA